MNPQPEEENTKNEEVEELDEFFKQFTTFNEYLTQDYSKIPTENTKLSKIERPHPTIKKVTKTHTLVLSSVQRNYILYPEPNKYLIDLYQPYKNVEQIELIAVMLPKTEYNVNTNNNVIKISINDSDYQYLYLTPGQYLIGTNKIGYDYQCNGDPFISGVLAELNNSLNTLGNFKVILCTAPKPYGTGQYASLLNRIAIINTDTLPFKIDFTVNNSAYRLLGFPKEIIYSGNNNIHGTSDGSCTTATLLDPSVVLENSILTRYDYNLLDYPNYLIMDLSVGRNSMNRNESLDKNINNSFCVILYDANDPDNIETVNINKGMYEPLSIRINRKQGNLKALKGTDFDKKIIKFDPPIIIENLEVKFYKYNNEPYNFNNREHMLSFELITAEFDPRYKV
jgi:hypothetical protein